MYYEITQDKYVIYGWGEHVATLASKYYIPVINWTIGPFVKERVYSLRELMEAVK
jgi:hypothetical protein